MSDSPEVQAVLRIFARDSGMPVGDLGEHWHKQAREIVRAVDSARPVCVSCGRKSADDGLGVVDGYCSACDGIR